MIMLFGQLLGLTGMFLSVPPVAAIKYFLISADVPPLILDPLLFLIEGDDTAPHRNFINKKKARAEGFTFSDGQADTRLELEEAEAAPDSPVVRARGSAPLLS